MKRPLVSAFRLLRQNGRGLMRRALNRTIAFVAPKPDVAPGSGDEPFPLAADLRARIGGGPGPDVLVFGDSVFLRVSDADEDRRTLAAMLVDACPGETVHPVAYSAYTPQLFEPFIALAGRLGARPRAVVIAFNLRCLSPQWQANPIWQYGVDRSILEALIAAPDSEVPSKPELPGSEASYRAAAFRSPLSRRRSVGAFRELIAGEHRERVTGAERRREILAFHYGMPARPAHPQLLFLRAAAEGARALGARVLVYLTPLNVDHIRAAGGEALLEIARTNAALALAAAGAVPGVVARDWSEAVPAEQFFHLREATEHLSASGRARLVALIVREIALMEEDGPVPAAPML